MTPSLTPLLRQRAYGYGIPALPGNSAVTSLHVLPNGFLAGATTGPELCRVFVFDNLLARRIVVLHELEGPNAIFHSLASTSDGTLYFGTMPLVDSQGRVAYPSNYAGGHLWRMSMGLGVNRNEEGTESAQFTVREVVDCGIPVEGEGIQCLLCSKDGRRIYGLTYPRAHLFYYDLLTRKCVNVGSGLDESVPAFMLDYLRRRDLVEDEKGHVYFTGAGGHFFQYSPSTDALTQLPIQVPGLRARREWDMAEVFCAAPGGPIWGGTTDGYLFKLLPDESRVINVGKPGLDRRIRGLVVTPDQRVYGVTGDFRDACHLFSYDPGQGHFEDLGMLTYLPVEDSSPWTVYQVETMTLDRNGLIWLGEADVTSHLLTYYP